MRSERSGTHPDDERGRQRKGGRVSNDVRKGQTGWNVRASDMVDRVGPTIRGQRPDLADRMEARARQTSPSVVDRLGPTDRDHSAGMVDRVATVVRGNAVDVADQMEPVFRKHGAGMVDREASVVRVERAGLLEVEDEVGQADEDADDLVAFRGRKSHLFPLWLGTYRWMCGLGGGGCRGFFRLCVETRPEQAKTVCAMLAHECRICR